MKIRIKQRVVGVTASIKYNLKMGFTLNGDLTEEVKRKIANLRALVQKGLDNIGILSLCEKENDPVLWERYGDKEKGVA